MNIYKEGKIVILIYVSKPLKRYSTPPITDLFIKYNVGETTNYSPFWPQG